MVLSRKTDNNAVRIHYYDSIEDAHPHLTPLVVCPGLSETAEEYLDLLEALLPRRSILLSFRGRGQSDTPDSGYNLIHHIDDIASVVRCAALERFHLFGYSRGASYALGYAQGHKEQIHSLLVGDYPPEHRAMPLDWPEDYINQYLIPCNRIDDYIRSSAVYGIQRESSQISLDDPLDIPVLVARGLLDGSMVSDIDLDRYKDWCSQLIVKEYAQSGHDIRENEKALFYSDIIRFLDTIG